MARKVVKVTSAAVEQAVRSVDWKAVDAMTDADIARQVAGNPDAAPLLTDAETAAGQVRALRARLGLSQPAFAARFHIPPGTLRDWEQGRRMPDRSSRAYLRVIEREPEAVDRALSEGSYHAKLPSAASPRS